MSKVFLFIVLLSICQNGLFAQRLSTAIYETYSFGQSNFTHKTLRLSDGSYILLSSVRDNRADWRYQLTKVNSIGKICWSLPVFNSMTTGVYYLGEALDNSLFIVADTFRDGKKATIWAKYDLQGNLISLVPILKYTRNYLLYDGSISKDKNNNLLIQVNDSIHKIDEFGYTLSKGYSPNILGDLSNLRPFLKGYLSVSYPVQSDDSQPITLSWLDDNLNIMKHLVLWGTHKMVVWKWMHIPNKGIAVLCGNQEANPVGRLIILGENGDEKWRAPMPFSGFLNDGFRNLAVDADSNLIVSGSVGGGVDTIQFVRYSINGDFGGIRGFSILDSLDSKGFFKNIYFQYFDVDPTDQRITGIGYQGSWNEKTEFQLSFLKFDNPWLEYKRPQMRLVIYPNPVRNEATVILPPESCCSKSSDIVVYDAQGREVFRDRNARNAEYQLRLPVLKQGIYLCRLLLDGKPFGAEKIFVQ